MNPKLFNKDYLLHLCQKFGLKPSKEYGQNYLLDGEVVEAMVQAGEVTKKDVVVEVGPGFGVLTLVLAEKAKKVIAFEIEKKLQKYWGEENKHLDNLEIVWGNALKNIQYSISDINKYKVVANLPYQITSNVIRLFLEAENPPSVLVTMVQKEVAERICAKPGDMSLLSLSVQFYADVEIVATVPRTLFWPEPAVDSAVIKITPHVITAPNCHPERSSPGRAQSKDPLKFESQGIPPLAKKLGRNDSYIRSKDFDKKFFHLVKAGFAQKRKLLSKNLLPIIGKDKKDLLKAVFLQLGLLETVRAQELSLEQWKNLTEKIMLD